MLKEFLCVRVVRSQPESLPDFDYGVFPPPPRVTDQSGIFPSKRPRYFCA